MSSAPIIVLSHGSRHPQADAQIEAIAAQVAKLGGGAVRVAHLDFSPLTLSFAAQLLAEEGYQRAVVVPLLFTHAFHMRHDVPQAIQQAERDAGIALTLAEGLGTGDDVADVVSYVALRAARSQGGPGRSRAPRRVALYSVGSSIPGANESVADLAQAVARKLSFLLGRRVDAEAFVATGPSADPQALSDYIDEATIVQPLFVAPGTLWDLQRDRLPGRGWVGAPLGAALAPLIVARAAMVERSRIRALTLEQA